MGRRGLIPVKGSVPLPVVPVGDPVPVPPGVPVPVPDVPAGRAVLALALAVPAVVVTVVPPDVEHAGLVMVSVSRVTAPLRARRRPLMVVPVVTVIDVSARMVPRNVDPVPSVAELPTCQ